MNTQLPQKDEWPKTVDGVCYLVLARNQSNPSLRQHGFLLGEGWDVHIGYIWEGGDGYCINYESEEEILNDGWEVD